MPRDNQTKIYKKDTSKSKKRDEESRKKKKEESSDDDNSFYTDDDDDEEEEMDIHEYRKFLKTMFPSKYLNKKIQAGEKLKKTIEYEEEDDDDSDDDENYEPPVKKLNKSIKHKKTNKPIKKIKEEFEDEECEEDHISSTKRILRSHKHDEEDIGSEDEDEIDTKTNTKIGKYNITFTIRDKDEDEFEDIDDEDWETCSSSGSGSGSNTENEDDPISSDSDSEEEVDVEKKKEEQFEEKDVKKEENRKHVKEEIDTEILTKLKEFQAHNPTDKSIEKCIKAYETDVKKQNIKKEKKIKKERDRNSRIFKRIIRDKNTMNDFEFYDKLEIEQQKKFIKELREINKITRVEKPYRLTLLESDIPVIFKATAMKKIASLRHMEPGSGEYYKIKNWVDTFMRIPFGKYENLPLSILDGVDKCHDFMENAQQTLDNAVYGLNDAKMQIMQLLGQLITNPKAVGSAIAISGPAGTGKTSLVKEGISKILNRPFAFIALGGATDSSFLEGHGYTYEGSTWGKIVQILIDSKCMNPVIYFDELDKISDTPKGEEITGILTHLTDTSQNSQFHDKYFTEIEFDLSKCLFIFSYNDETKVNPILKDRMYRIQTKGYNQKQKTIISNNYLLPKIREQVKFTTEDIIIPEPTIHYIIENHCNKEDGVRNLKRCLEIIHTKLNLYRLMRPSSNLFEEEMSLKVQFPFTVTKDVVDKLVKKSDNGLSPSLYMFYC